MTFLVARINFIALHLDVKRSTPRWSAIKSRWNTIKFLRAPRANLDVAPPRKMSVHVPGGDRTLMATNNRFIYKQTQKPREVW